MNYPLPSHMNSYHRSSVATATIIGALASAVVKATINTKKVKEGTLTPKAALADTLKGAAQGAVATAGVAGIHETLAREEHSNLNALAYGAMGIVGVYAIEKLSDRYCASSKEA